MATTDDAHRRVLVTQSAEVEELKKAIQVIEADNLAMETARMSQQK
jgi:hypothetical protein